MGMDSHNEPRITDNDDAYEITDHKRPRVVFPSPLKLSREQEDRLKDHCEEQIDKLSKELGRDVTIGDSWLASGDYVNQGAKSHMGKRQLYEMTYSGNMDWRRYVLGGIFGDSNHHAPITKRVVMQQVARANDFFFGSEPYLEAVPEGANDKVLAKAVDRWLKHTFRVAGIRGKMENVIERSFVLGECVVKRSYKNEIDLFQANMEILVAGPKGEPIQAADGDYIMREDLISVATTTEGEEVQVLARDGQTIIPEDAIYEMRTVTRKMRREKGPDVESVFYKDWLCPLTAKSVEDADFCSHLYDIPASDLADQWRRHELGVSNEQRKIDTANAVQAIRDIQGNSPDNKDLYSGSTHREGRTEDSSAAESINQSERNDNMARIAECWLRFDANEDGISESIMVIMDRDSGALIYADYAGNVTPDGKRPFSVVRTRPVEGRWYGVGSIEEFDGLQKATDLALNRWNFSESRAGRVDFWDPTATLEGCEDPNLEMNWGGTYTLCPEKTAEDALTFVTLPETKAADLKELIEYNMQLALAMSGVQNANDSGMAGLQSAKLATSINNLEKSGDELFSQLISHLEVGVEETISGLSELALVNVDEEEAYSYIEGDGTEFSTINRNDLQTIRLNVRILLSKYRTEARKQSLLDAFGMVERFGMQPPEVQPALYPIVKEYMEAQSIDAVEAVTQVMEGGIVTEQNTGPTAVAPSQPRPSEGQAADYSAQAEGGIKGGIAANGG